MTSRAGIRILDPEDYLTKEEREKRSEEKQKELIEERLTPDWFVNQGELCLPAGLRVAVIGAGFAGLAAAWYLNTCGVKTTLFEANERVGGRVQTDHNFIQGKLVEAGAELIGENHPLWLILAKRFGPLKLDELTDDEAYKKKQLAVRLRLNGHDLTPDEKTALQATLRDHFTAIGKEAVGIKHREPWKAPFADSLDRESVSSRLKRLPPGSPHALPWFDFTLGNDNCATIANQSYLGLLCSVSAARMGSDRKGMFGYWMSTETHRCKGGNDQLANLIRRSLPDVRVLTAVTAIEIELAFIVRPVRIASTTSTGRGPVQHVDEFDAAILTVPPTVWKNITFTPGFDVRKRSLQHGPAVKFFSRYPTKFWEDKTVKLAPTTKWNGLGSVWEGTDNQPDVPEFGLIVFSGGQFVQPASSYPGKLATLYPTGSPSGDMFVDWEKAAFIEAGYAVPGREQVTTIGKKLHDPHHERLYFAGEQVSMGFFGYMEGALQSGARAALEIVKRWARRCDGSIEI